MNIGEEWLRSWVNPSISSKNLCKQMINVGFEIEKNFDFCKKIFTNVVVGKVISNSIDYMNSKYMVYNVKIDLKKTICVVSKNKKIISGTKIPIALIGSVLSNGTKISLKNINNIFSYGKFCSFHDLNIELYNYNIIILPKNIKVGIDFFKYLYKSILKINFPTNRTDLHSIIGIAREISIINRLDIPKIPCYLNIKSKKKYKCCTYIEINNILVQYFSREIYSINSKSVLPFKIRERLRIFGMLQNNILINIINYVYIETGHWIHIFDLDDLCGNIFLRYANHTDDIDRKSSTSFINLEKNIVLTDEKKILSLNDMSIIKNAHVNINTKNIFFGSICFDPFFLHNTEKKITNGYNNTKFLKYNICSEIQLSTIEYCTNLIVEICGGISTIMQKKFFSLKPIKKLPIKLDIKDVNKIIGHSFTKKNFLKILDQCKFKYFYEHDIFFITAPFWRTDIHILEDIVGEIVRMYGCDKIVSTPPITIMSKQCKDKKYQLLSCVKSFLVSSGYYEIISYSFINSKFQKVFFPKKNNLEIMNPISIDMSVMRKTLWIGLINCISYNQNRQNKSIRIFETGLCFIPNKINSLQVNQINYLSGAISGYINPRVWNLKYRKFDFYDLKGIVESIFKIFGCLNFIQFSLKKVHGLCIKQSVGIYLFEKLIGIIGILDKSLHKTFHLKDSVILFEIFWEKLNYKKSIIFKNISELPVIIRDISIIISDFIDSSDIIQTCIHNIFLKNVNIYIYDIYQGSGIPLGKKSISIRFIFESKKKMLRENDININIEQCISELKKQFQAILRD